MGASSFLEDRACRDVDNRVEDGLVGPCLRLSAS